MSDPAHDVFDLIFGRWRSQILYARGALGVFDHLTPDNDASAQGIADAVGADPVLLYRLLRALATIGLPREACLQAKPECVHNKEQRQRWRGSGGRSGPIKAAASSST